MIKSHQSKIWRETYKYWNRELMSGSKPRNKVDYICPGWSNYQIDFWRPMKNGFETKKIVLPHEVAESEEKETSINWGEISETDTGLDSIEDDFSEKEKKSK